MALPDEYAGGGQGSRPADCPGSGFFGGNGGGFTSGAGSESRYDGEALAKKGVVVVTSNYRLGAFGWFAHDIAEGETLFQATATRWRFPD